MSALPRGSSALPQRVAIYLDGRALYLDRPVLKNDLMSEYLRHTGSGLWAIPPGVADGGYMGQPLFAA